VFSYIKPALIKIPWLVRIKRLEVLFVCNRHQVILEVVDDRVPVCVIYIGPTAVVGVEERTRRLCRHRRSLRLCELEEYRARHGYRKTLAAGTA
jgi:hypothetical protein